MITKAITLLVAAPLALSLLAAPVSAQETTVIKKKVTHSSDFGGHSRKKVVIKKKYGHSGSVKVKKVIHHD